ncbi:MAG: class I SAM-dependent methyltransferase [Candidatus Aenigmatarchaeota archaeon]
MKYHPEELAPDTWIKENLFKRERIYEIFKGKTVLDCGCGTGFFTKVVESTCRRIIGVDISKTNIQVARKLSPHIKFIRADILNLPFKREAFDIVMALDVIDHLHDRKKGLDEMIRVLKKDGFLILAFTTNPIIFRFLTYMIELHSKIFYYKGHPETHPFGQYNDIDIKELKKYLKLKGFIILKEKKFRGFLPLSLTIFFIYFDGFLRLITNKKINSIGDSYFRLKSSLCKFYKNYLLPIIKFFCKVTITDFDNAGYLIIAKKVNA